MFNKFKNISTLFVLVSLLCSCGGGGGDEDEDLFLGGNWKAQNIVLINENCTDMLGVDTPPDPVADDMDYSIQQDGSSIIMTDEDGSYQSELSDDGFEVIAPDENLGNLLQGSFNCVGHSTFAYTAVTDNSGSVEIKGTIECLETQSQEVAASCEITYQGVSNKL